MSRHQSPRAVGHSASPPDVPAGGRGIEESAWRVWMRDLGRRQRRLREFLGLSQEQLARLAGVSQGALSRLETAKGLAPVERYGSQIVTDRVVLLPCTNRRLQFSLRFVPQIPFAQDRFERAIANDLVNGRIDLGLQCFVTFAQTDIVSATQKRSARGFQGRV